MMIDHVTPNYRRHCQRVMNSVIKFFQKHPDETLDAEMTIELAEVALVALRALARPGRGETYCRARENLN